MNHYIPHRSRKFSIVRSGKPVAYEYGNSAFEAIGLLTIQETEGYAVKCQDKADNTSNELRKYEIYLNEHFITVEEGHSWVEALGRYIYCKSIASIVITEVKEN